MSILDDPTLDIPAIGIDEGTRRETLLKAAELIETRGWTTGSLNDSNGFCVLGAVAYSALGDSEYRHHAMCGADVLYMLAAEILGEHDEVVYDWNDSGGNTAKNVTRVLRDVANGTPFKIAKERT